MAESIRIRWATWWPVPYWTERFNLLARTEGIELEVAFLSQASKLLPLAQARQDWAFRYFFVRKAASDSGYSAVRLGIPRPWSLLRGDFDLLIMPYGDPDFVAAALLCRLLGKPYCLFMPNNAYDARPESWFRHRLKRWLGAGARGALSTGPSQSEYAAAFVDSRRVFRVGNPAPLLKGLAELRREPGRARIRMELGYDHAAVLLYVGRLAPEKGLHTLVEAIRRVRQKGFELRTVLVGSGPLDAEMAALADTGELGLELAGMIEGEALTRRYLAADMFVLPSRTEPWGLVVNEAMEAGLPVIASDRVGAREVLVEPEKTGLIFRSGRVDELADAITRLVDDESLRKRMAKEAEALIANHDIPAWRNAVLQAVQALLVRASARRKNPL